MAALMDETMEGYVYPFYNDYSYHYQPPKGRRGAGPWRQQSRGVVVGGGGYFSGYDEGHAAAVAAAAAAEYLENYQREQLKAILAQVNPNLTPRMCKANTKEVGVQVNPRQDASVQCSLGSRPLLLQRRGGGSEQEHGSPVTGAPRAVRFPRTIAIYSSVASRRRILTTVVEETESAEPSPPPHVEQGADEKKPPATTPPQPAGEEGAEAKQDKGQLPAQPSEQADEEPGEQGAESGGQTASPPQDEGGAGKARARFQFLEQKYGYYHCKDCNIRWESAYVWCVQGTNKVYFRQLCRICEKSYNPYRVEDITCQASNDF